MSEDLKNAMTDFYSNISFGGGGGDGGGGGWDVANASTTASASNSSPSASSHNVCVAGYASVGGLVGGIATSETFGWGAVPGVMIGTAIGEVMCR